MTNKKIASLQEILKKIEDGDVSTDVEKVVNDLFGETDTWKRHHQESQTAAMSEPTAIDIRKDTVMRIINMLKREG